MELEFRSYKDDAWYDARIVTESSGGGRLRVKFSGFADDQDELIDVKNLRSLEEVSELTSRFRSISAQLQDSECPQVHKGMIVCAAHSVCPEDRRFFDAVVDGVVRKQHEFKNGEEQCKCKFILLWKHGPNERFMTDQTLENICRVQPAVAVEKLDPQLASFLKSAGDRIEVACFSDANAGSHDATSVTKTCRLNNGQKKPNFLQRLNQDSRLARWSSSELKDSEHIGDDIDIGGVPHMIIIENLEKGISPLTIMEFIHQQLSISCQAFVSPSKKLEIYARGTILLDSKSNFDKLSYFLENPDHIIVSSRGRPWVMTEKAPVDDTLRALIETLRLKSQKVLQSRTGICKELKVVIFGTEEYRKAKQLKEVFKEFAKHMTMLHQRLLLEEGRVM